jgi:hypothetical protein
MKERLYHIVAINERTGRKTYVTCVAMNHKDACTVLKKFSPHPARRMQLEQV